jgi:putative ABC transport system ATP-binding protein
MTTAVELQGAGRAFGAGHTRVVALAPTSLVVTAGELLAIMGPSGSGKTTLLSLVGGLDRPTDGSVLVEGVDVGRLDSRGLAILRRRTVGYVFQDLNLLAGLTARENVSLPLELDGRPMGEARTPRRRSLRWGLRHSRIATRTTSQAANSSAWRSRAPSSGRAGSSWPTSRPGRSTR